jgi:thiosulfate dehydrogenase
MTDDGLNLKPALAIVSAILIGGVLFLAANGLIAAVGDEPAVSMQSDTGDASTNEAGPRELPATWQGMKWYDKGLRDKNLEFRDPNAGEKVQFQPKQMNNSTLPENENRRELVKYGRQLFADTSTLMPNHTGGDRMSCANCHGGGSLSSTNGMVGQDIDMIPLVGTAAGYPEWTGRTERMRDMRQRIQGCFLRSMNADDAEEGVPAYDSREIQAMEAYMEWLGKGTPIGSVPYWRHLEKPEGDQKTPVPEINPVRGAELYMQNCASCHGADGQGEAGQYPPLWGPDSFNDGAGMGRVYTSAAFVREAMPYGYAHTVTDWDDVQDIAGYMNGHDRPSLDRKPKDWAADGPPNEAVYYDRTQERLGYDMNPMTKKLMLAGIPTGTEPVSNGDIPDDVERYDEPLRNVSVENDSTGNTTAENETSLRDSTLHTAIGDAITASERAQRAN